MKTLKIIHKATATYWRANHRLSNAHLAYSKRIAYRDYCKQDKVQKIIDTLMTNSKLSVNLRDCSNFRIWLKNSPFTVVIGISKELTFSEPEILGFGCEELRTKTLTEFNKLR